MKRGRVRLAVLAISLSAAMASIAAADEGWRLMEQGDLAGAEAYWRPRAEAGEAGATAGLAHIATLRGDDRRALALLHRAAALGETSSLALLGSAYLEGRGTARDPFLAYAWYELAAEKGVANAARARDLAGKWLSPERQGEARALAQRWQTEGLPPAPG